MRKQTDLPVTQLAIVALLAFGAPSFGALKMFVTSDTHTGDFNGVANADAFCQAAADNATPPLIGTFKAWLSTTTDDAYCRVAGLPGKVSTNCGQGALPDAGPWQRVDGQPFTWGLKALTISGQILTTPVIDEDGNSLVSTQLNAPTVYTGTNFAGVASGGNCTNWDETVAGVTYANPFFGPFYWTNYGAANCDQLRHLYCFETGVGTPLPTFEYDGALAFISSTAHNGSFPNGIAGADDLCQGLAAGAFLPHSSSFQAWLSDSTTDAVDRLTHTGAFKRVDGVEIAASKADLVGALQPWENALTSGIWKTELDVTNFFFAWTGSSTAGTATANHCGNWMSNLNEDHGDFGAGNSMLGSWANNSPTFFNCDSAIYYYYCFSNVPILYWDNFEGFPPLQRWSSTQQ